MEFQRLVVGSQVGPNIVMASPWNLVAGALVGPRKVSKVL